MSMETREPGEEVLRAFIALDLNEEVRVALDRLQNDLKMSDARVSWVATERIHLTLVFLGEIFAAQVAGLAAALDSVTTECAPFCFEVAGVGVFGPPASPRIVWAGVKEASGSLQILQSRVSEAVAALGFRIETRPYRPHLTLGRVRERRGAADLTSRLESFTSLRCGRVEVRRLLLMRSLLSPQGAEYRVLHSSELKGA